MPFRQILRHANSFDKGVARRAREYLERLHAELTRRLVANIGTKWEIIHYEQARREVAQILADVERQLSLDLIDTINQAGKIGLQLADDVFKGIVTLFGGARPSLTFVNEAAQASATLIKGITDGIRAKIDIEIDQGIQGLKTGIQAIKAIADVKDFTGIAFKTAEQRAEDIFRTEASRIINMATIARYREYQEQSEKELLKYWLATSDSRTRETHLQIWNKTDPARGGKPISFNADFKLADGERAFGPQAPTLSAGNVINCRCRLIVITKEKYLEMKGA